MTNLQKSLFELQDLKYRDFHSSLMPTIDKNLIIGIRTPVLKKFAKDFSKTDGREVFLRNLPHKYYEENNLHIFLLNEIKDFKEAVEETEKFLPYIDNWATCDGFCPKAFLKNRELLLPKIREWLESDRVYTVRYGLRLLEKLYLDEKNPEIFELAASVRSEEYYINMMQAWFFATALAKQEDLALPYVTENRLSTWVNNKTIQKARESFRVSDKMKNILKEYKR